MDVTQEEIIRRLKNVYLIPFYVLCAVYFVLYQPFLHYPEETFSAAFFKVLPIFALIAFVRLNVGDENVLQNPIPKSDFHRFTILGLIFSSIGDACLIARETMFIPGMLFFTIAQAWYLYALGPGSKGSRLQSIFYLGGVGTFLFLESGIEGIFMKFLVLIYTVLIFTVAWRAASRFERENTYPALLGFVGILLFTLSDFLIGVNKWKFYIPFSEFLVMMTYYGGQFGIALGSLRE
ncbi:lysoplasmalogenase TMEM86A-like [Saccostrea echinata]|uniref:lysoplasmalogenase TMEM86A-like n=1 Tax=Saccostrea echinata TaxID=191078 RepID=UPI002A835CA0|nr:lysoplasmalogenase TMEM86A-like [Saccostrea echinata]